MILAAGIPSRGAEIRIDNARDADPRLNYGPAPITFYNDEFLPLWLRALRRPEADMQRVAAETIAQAHTAGFPKMVDARPDLLKILAATGSHPSARFAAAHALIVLDTRGGAPELFAAAKQYGSSLRQLVEPALADWDYAPLRPVWLERVRNPQTNRRELMLAIRGLGRVREAQAIESLLAIVHSPLHTTDMRLAAAHAAGDIRETGLEPESARLSALDTASISQRLCAIALLRRHSDATSQSRLLKLARDGEPAVAAAALARLLEIDPALVLPLAEGAMQSGDAKVRERGVAAYVALPTPERVRFLSRMLNDVHPDIRASVRESLFRLAGVAELDGAIRDSAMQILHQEGWRGQEQSGMLLAALDHKPAAPRFVDLLVAARPEVMVTAAWGLRKLAVPEMLPPMLEMVRKQTELRLQNEAAVPPRLDEQVGHLCEAMGVMKYQPSEPLLRRYVAKNFAMGDASRCAAIWALGHLHSGVPDEALARQLMGRITDVNPLEPELASVQQMSAITIGRMKAVSQAPAMKQWLGPSAATGDGEPGLMWAITQLTGEQFPERKPAIVGRSGWFLEPTVKSGGSSATP